MNYNKTAPQCQDKKVLLYVFLKDFYGIKPLFSGILSLKAPGKATEFL